MLPQRDVARHAPDHPAGVRVGGDGVIARTRGERPLPGWQAAAPRVPAPAPLGPAGDRIIALARPFHPPPWSRSVAPAGVVAAPSRRLDDETLPRIASERPRVGGIDSLGTDPFDLGGHTPQRATAV